MDYITKYITKGRGIGLTIVLIYIVIQILFKCLYLKNLFVQYVLPPTLDVAAQILPIQIENGTIIYPENTRKEINIYNSSIMFVLDTNVSDFDIRSSNKGIYISKNKIYIKYSHNPKIINIEGTHNIPAGDYSDKLISMFNVLIGGAGFLAALISFFATMMIILIYCCITYPFSNVIHQNFPFVTRMRMSTVSYVASGICVYFIRKLDIWDNPLLFYILNFGLLFYLFIMLAKEQNQEQ